MPLFKYKIISKAGSVKEGMMDAKDKFSLYHELKLDGSTVIYVEEEKTKGAFSFLTNIKFFDGVKTHDKIVFAKNLSKMLEAGLAVTKALSIMERQSRGSLKKIIQSLIDSISKGKTLSESMKSFPNTFSTLFVSMVHAGEESGNLSLSLDNVANQMDKSYQLTRKIRGAMMYPAVIFCLMIVIGILMMVYMVPTLTSTFVGLGIKLPLSTRIIIGLSDFLKSYFLLVIVLIGFSIASVVYFFKTKIGKRFLDFLLLHTPVIKEIVKQVNSARTARTLSSLISSGVDIVIAIGVTKDVVQNSYYKNVLDNVQANIQKGETISNIFTKNSDIYPLFVGEMVSVGEETGKIGEMLMSVASFYEDEVDQKTKDLSSIIEPLLMIFIGLGVGIFAISMLAPTYSLADAI